MKKLILLSLSAFLITACGNTDSPPAEKEPLAFPLELKTYETNPSVVMETSMGKIEMELFTTEVPEVAGSFMTLAEAGAYDGSIFHRIIDGFMIQGGDFQKGDGTGGVAYNGVMIDDEIGEGLSNVIGTLSMANRGLECEDEKGQRAFVPDPAALTNLPNITCSGTNGSQFFINQADNIFLDGKHSVFGKVTKGMDVVEKMAKVETTGKGSTDRPVKEVSIKKITLK